MSWAITIWRVRAHAGRGRPLPKNPIPEMRKRPYHLLGQAALLVVIWGAIFEAGLRVQQYFGPLYDLEMASISLSWKSDVVNHRPAPEDQTMCIYGDLTGFSYKRSYDANGIRIVDDRELLAGCAHPISVLFLGDSFMEGYDDKNTLPYQVAKYFRNERGQNVGVKASPIGHECSVGLMEAREHPLYLMRFVTKLWHFHVHMPAVLRENRSDLTMFAYSQDHGADLEQKYREALSSFRQNLQELADVLTDYTKDPSRVLFIYHPHLQHLKPDATGRMWND